MPGFVGALVILKIPPDTNGSNSISCSNNELTWWGFIAPAIMTSSRGLFRIISISYFEPVRTLSGILKMMKTKIYQNSFQKLSMISLIANGKSKY